MFKFYSIYALKIGELVPRHFVASSVSDVLFALKQNTEFAGHLLTMPYTIKLEKILDNFYVRDPIDYTFNANVYRVEFSNEGSVYTLDDSQMTLDELEKSQNYGQSDEVFITSIQQLYLGVVVCCSTTPPPALE